MTDLDWEIRTSEQSILQIKSTRVYLATLLKPKISFYLRQLFHIHITLKFLNILPEIFQVLKPDSLPCAKTTKKKKKKF